MLQYGTNGFGFFFPETEITENYKKLKLLKNYRKILQKKLCKNKILRR
jgi:hypothetical protein